MCDVQPGPLQDAIKKTSKDELPDFYNIQLERPKDDDKGYDVLFIDAASKVSTEALPHRTCSVPCMAVFLCQYADATQVCLNTGWPSSMCGANCAQRCARVECSVCLFHGY